MSKTPTNFANNSKPPLQLNTYARKFQGQQKTGELKKSSIFFSNPTTSNSSNYESNKNPSTDYKSKYETFSAKKSEGNINMNTIDKKLPSYNNNFSSNLEKTGMYSSQIVNATNSNSKKGGLESLGKFITTNHQNQINDKYQPPKKPFQPTFNQLKNQNLENKLSQQKNIPKSSNTQSETKLNSQTFTSKSQTNINLNNDFKNYPKPPLNMKSSENPQSFNFPKKLQIPNDIKDYKKDFLSDSQKKFEINNKSNQVPTMIPKKTTQPISDYKKLDNDKKIDIGPSFNKKIISYETTNDYLNYKKNINQSQTAKKPQINQIIIPTSMPFSKDRIKIPEVGKQTSSNTKSTLSKSDFYIGKKLGKGQFGEVFLAKHKKTGFVCAMKIIKKYTIHQEQVEDQLVRELKIQLYLNHNNLAALYGFFNDMDNVYLLLELCSQGQLFDILKEKKRLPEDQVSQIIGQVCNGLEYIHRQRIIHRDIKPQNVIMHLGVAKICDFGWAVYRGDGMRTTFCGTPLYTSPELLRGQQYDQKIDIWAVGILTYQLIIGRIPFKILSEGDMSKILNEQITFPEFVDISSVAKDFILKILKKNPQDRFEVEQLIHHQFLSKKKPNPYKFDITI